MINHLVIGIFAVALGFGMVMIGRPNNRGESPRFLRSHAAPMFYTPAVLAVFALGIAEIVIWALGAK